MCKKVWEKNNESAISDGLKSLSGEMKKSMEGLKSRVTIAGGKIGELHDEMQETSINQQKMKDRLKINKKKRKMKERNTHQRTRMNSRGII